MAPDAANEPTPTPNPEATQQTAATPPPNDTPDPVAVTPTEPTTPAPQASEAGVQANAVVTPEVTQPTVTPPTVATPAASTEPQTSTQPNAQPNFAQPAQPGQSFVMGGAAGAPDTQMSAPTGGKSKKRRKLPLIIALVVALLLLGGGYVFAFYLPNTPANMYKAALDNTNKAYDKLVEYSASTQAKHYKGFTASGSFKLTSPTGSGDGTFTAASDGSNSQGNVNVDIVGEKLNANYRAIVAKGQTTPDVYLQVTGIKKMLDGFGLNKVDYLDGQWISVDHTIIETGLAQAQGTTAKKTAAPSYADVNDAMVKVGEVNKKYLFTTDSQYAVLRNEQYLGKSNQDGRTVAGYKVGYDKAHLQAYLSALGPALDSSGLGKWYKQANGKDISAELQFDQAKKDLAKAKSDYTFNMYVDTKTHLIHKVHFADTKDPANNYFEGGLNYVGGSKYPLVFDVHTKDGSSVDTAHLALTLDSTSNEIVVKMNAASKSNTLTTFNLDMTAKPTNDPLTVTVPSKVKTINSVLESLGLGGLLKK